MTRIVRPIDPPHTSYWGRCGWCNRETSDPATTLVYVPIGLNMMVGLCSDCYLSALAELDVQQECLHCGFTKRISPDDRYPPSCEECCNRS